jgi:hypothetical protein
MMKSDSSKETRVPEDKSLLRLLQDKMIMSLGMEAGSFRAQFAAHPEMNSDPIPAGKFEEDLLAASARAQEPASS